MAATSAVGISECAGTGGERNSKINVQRHNVEARSTAINEEIEQGCVIVCSGDEYLPPLRTYRVSRDKPGYIQHLKQELVHSIAGRVLFGRGFG